MNQKYSRQIKLNFIGETGQEKISKTKIIIIGMGALGSKTAELLIRAGVKNLILIDNDKIEESNLQRQSLYYEDDVGKFKVDVAKTRLKRINSKCNIETKKIWLDNININNLNNFDFILDCTDNLETRFLINKFCKENKKIWIFSSAVKTHGYVMPIFPEGPCLNCFLKNIKLDTADSIGIINTITSSIAALQVTITFKLILGFFEKSMLYYYDIWNGNLKKIKVKINPKCNLCNK